jgi:histidine triad (HIT) family protein
MAEDCLFCKIAAGKMGDIVFRDEDITAFKDINPQAPTHILIIPNKHIASVSAATEADQALLGRLLLVAAQLADEQGLTNSGGYRLVTNTGPQAGQSVHHLHLHLLGGRPMKWPPG